MHRRLLPKHSGCCSESISADCLLLLQPWGGAREKGLSTTKDVRLLLLWLSGGRAKQACLCGLCGTSKQGVWLRLCRRGPEERGLLNATAGLHAKQTSADVRLLPRLCCPEERRGLPWLPLSRRASEQCVLLPLLLHASRLLAKETRACRLLCWLGVPEQRIPLTLTLLLLTKERCTLRGLLDTLTKE